MSAIEITFWIAAGLIVYTLCGYPVLSLILAAVIRKHIDRQPITPRVSFIISARNEEESIAEKLRQTLDLDYPADKLEVIVASDASTDRTDDIVRSFEGQGVKLHRNERWGGKTDTLNGAVQASTGEILIFSDATGVYNSLAIREIVSNFNDPTIGCVTGRVTYRYGTDATSKGFGAYQRVAVAIRRSESRWGSQTSVSGSIHAVRRDLFRPSRATHSPDVTDAIHTVIQGYRVIYENNATALEESRTRLIDEFRARVRIGIQNTTMLPYVLGQLLRHLKLSYLFQVISHKVLVWYLWLLLLIAFVTNLLLANQSSLYASLAIGQCAMYAVAGLGLLAGKRKRGIPLVSSLSFFVLGNAATCVGVLKCLAGHRAATWQSAR